MKGSEAEEMHGLPLASLEQSSTGPLGMLWKEIVWHL